MSVKFESQSEPIPGYKLLDRLGSGGFGEVWKAIAPGGIHKAVKVIHGDLRSHDNDLVRYAEQELKALKRVQQVRHPYLLALDRYDIVDGRLMITMELADCNLWDRFREHRAKGLPGIPRDELMLYMTESAEVLDLMNDQFQLQHLDIKPQNLFLLYNHVKVADFGQVKDLEGMVASVTGGITPVYAAPETFDGLVTKYCDQYSLACVYQELLTGVRPFDGNSMSQLLMQHLNLPPNLDPSPRCDRPALARALSKKPEDRWPNVSSFVRALRDGATVSVPVASTARHPDPTTVLSGGSASHAALGAASASADAGPTPPNLDTPAPWAPPESAPAAVSDAPPELTGPGPLRPTVVIALGQTGLRVLQRFRHDLAERYGGAHEVPLVRSFYVDTDPETLEDAVRPRPEERLAGLGAEDVFAAKLNRTAHYLKPRFNGRTLTEGWFDTQLLYRIPRTPQTMGVRLFGRLAFCDHYRPLMAKFQAELETALNPESLYVTERRTGLARRTNRPQVVVVAGVGGATGGGMLLDVAYAVRSRLKRMGYERPDVSGVLLLPPADPANCPPAVLGNGYAAVTELNHYSRPETVFTAHYDDRNGQVREKDAPFSRVVLVPGWAGPADPSGVASPPPRRGFASGVVPAAGSRVLPAQALARPAVAAAPAETLKPVGEAAELLRLSLLSPVGRVADEARAKSAAAPRPAVSATAFGVAVFDWPRGEVVARTAERLGLSLLKQWAAPNPKRYREVIPGWAADKWAALGLNPETVLGRLHKAADGVAGGRVEELISLATEPLVPKGWLSRLPEPEKVAVVMDKFVRQFGLPTVSGKRPPTPTEEALAQAAAAAADGFLADLREVVAPLVEDKDFRLAGAEEVVRQFLATTDRLLERHTALVAEHDAKGVVAYECLANYTHFDRGTRKPAAGEFADALRVFPRSRHQSVVLRQLVEIYRVVREGLAGLLQDVSHCRQQLDAAIPPPPPDEPEGAASPRRLFPAGCPTMAAAVERFAKVLTDADRAELDHRVQAIVDAEAEGLLHALLNVAVGPAGIVRLVLEEAQAYLDARLGEVDLAAMFADRFRTPQAAELAVADAFTEAEPGWVGRGPWSAGEVVVLAGPPSGPLREIAQRGIPVAGLPTADTRDELTIYREYPAVPLAALPQLGPAAASAYATLPDTNQCSPHSRLDITVWTDVDKD